ncbi:PilZ domain-containing protein [Aestuariivirga sp.]|uniref:PilZ domain-containing protein n=1 Tax=Aestuariivirga sp. TaxID=2650926 RepID=UPI0025BA8A49|nr:PilZ domain-containing protein [Aestuariivirga sp.]MCA3555215.1 PilZ domain-containing protein [Aestuariivirga sp.]
MPAQPPRAVLPLSHPALDQRRRSGRRACSLAVTVRTGGGDYLARLLDLSADGIALRIDALAPLRVGARLILIHPELCEVACVLRWSMHPRYGAEFQATDRALARIRAFYDSLPPGLGEII